MSRTNDRVEDGWAKRREWLKRKLVPVLTLILVIAIAAGIYLVYGRHPERLTALENYTYGGVFLISLIGNAAVIVAVPVLPIFLAIGIVLYPATGPVGPIIVGLAGGAGAGIGEATGYIAGYSGRGIVERVKLYNRLVEWLRRWGALAVFILSIVPFFYDLVGIAAGALRFPLWKFMLFCWLGRTILYVSIVLAGALGWDAILRFF